MEKIEYKGVWWLPDYPDDKVSGILTLISQENTKLELFGIFEENDWIDKVNKIDLVKYDIVLGYANEKEITLLSCSRINFKFSGNSSEIYSISTIILGYNFNEINNICFDKINIIYSGLTNWMNNYIETTLPFNSTQPQEYNFKYVQKDIVSANITQGKISVCDFPDLDIKAKQLKFNCSGQFEIEVNQKLSLKQWSSDFIIPLLNFLTFATNKPNKIKKICFEIEEEKLLKVLNASMDFSDYDSTLFPTHKMLFTLDDIKDQFALMMQLWFNLHDSIRNVLNLYFSVQYNDNLSLENQFLMLVQAVESYHRIQKKNYVLPEDEHEKRIKSIINTTSPEHQPWLKEKLNCSNINEPSLKERLEELVKLHWLVMKSIVLDKEQFIKDVKNSRNYYTHYDQKIKNKALKEEPLFRLTQKLTFLLQACFLNELKCTPERCLELISRNGEYQHLQRIINETNF